MSHSHLVSIPPAFTSGKPHHGHALYLSLIDSVNNLLKHYGYRTKMVLGYDTHGLPIKMKVKQLKSILYIKQISDITLARRFSVQAIKSFEELVKKLGVTIEQRWSTEDLFYQITVDEFFETAVEKNLIYLKKNIQQYCVYCEQYLAQSETGVRVIQKQRYSMHWTIGGKQYKIMTTRPQLIKNAVAIAVNPALTEISGEWAYIDKLNLKVPVIKDPIAKLDESSNGLCMIAFCGSRTDYEFITKYNLPYKNYLNVESRQLYDLNYIDLQSTVKKLVSELLKLQVISKDGLHTGTVIIHAERTSCQKRIQYHYSDQIYLAIQPIKQDLLNMLDRIQIYPEKYRVIIRKWIQNVHDWCIGRRYPWGSHINLVQGTETLKTISDILKEPIINFYFDVWFESAVAWYYTLKCASQLNLETTSVQVQGYEILNTWLFYSLVAAVVLDKSVPFNKVRLTSLLLNSQGKKYSKSMKNYISPTHLIEQYGASAFRLWAVQQHSDADTVFNEQDINNAKKSLIKLASICKFYKMYKTESLQQIDSFEAGQKLYEKLLNLVEIHVQSVIEHYEYSKIKTIISFIHNEISRQYLTTYYYMRSSSRHNEMLGKMLKIIIQQIYFICPDILQQNLYQDMKGILF